MRATFGIGGAILAAGLALMATTHGLQQYFLGAGLAGLGFTLCALIPGVAVINQWLPQRRSFAIGAYMTIGGLGGVAGPLVVTRVVAETGSWRMHWWVMSISIAVLAVLAVALLKSPPGSAGDAETSAHKAEKHSDRVYKTLGNWQFKDIWRTPQFLIIVAAQTVTLLSGVTTNTWAVSHMGNLGIVFAVAAGALSGHALVNASSRTFGGALATWVDPKWLLASALVAEIIGMLALSHADNMTMIVLFALGEGYGFGMCMFATTILLVNYFGAKEAPKTIGTMYLVTTLATLGPYLGGVIADRYGGFTGVFQFFAVTLAVCLFAVVFMRPPTPRTH
jgi:MFS family permease